MFKSSKFDLSKAQMLENKVTVLSESLEQAREEKQDLLMLTNRLREQVNDLETSASMAKTQADLLNSKLLQELKQRSLLEARIKKQETDAMRNSTASAGLLEEENIHLKQRLKHLESVVEDLKAINAGMSNQDKGAKQSEKDQPANKKSGHRTNEQSDSDALAESRNESSMQVQVLQNQKKSLEKENLELHASLEEAMEKIYLLETQSNKNYSLMQAPESQEWGRLQELIQENGFETEEGPLR